jgi:hypothetical protein
MGQKRNDAETRRNGETETGPTKAYHLPSFWSRIMCGIDSGGNPERWENSIIIYTYGQRTADD